MRLYIKYMVSNRCKMAVKKELQQLGIHHLVVGLSEVEVMEQLTAEVSTPFRPVQKGNRFDSYFKHIRDKKLKALDEW